MKNSNHIIVLINKTTNMATLTNKGFELPSISLLNEYAKSYSPSQEDIDSRSEQILSIFDSFGVSLEKGDVSVGSNVTQYEFVPSKGTKLSKIKGLENDIALHLGVIGVRIIAPVKGKGVVAVEVPNIESNMVGLKDILTSDKDKIINMELPITLGETSIGEPFSFDLTKAPHVLIGGATGQGKSVGINIMLTSLLFNTPPSKLKFMLVDVKKVELDIYNEISEQYKTDFTNRLVYTETEEIVKNLNNVVSEMDTRYDMLKRGKCRNIKQYNKKCVMGELSFNEGHMNLPYIVVVIDEFADLMMTVGKDVEFPITRLAQLSRAVGIHLIVATQRPTTSVITGSIKANFPTRIAFRVASNIDSRTILDSGGAENLIGKGDLLYSNGMDLERIQSAFIDMDEIERLMDSISKQQSGRDIW
jgi:S-DNA-T family DNA segregation ATPase FtsK/SpoIIIE